MYKNIKIFLKMMYFGEKYHKSGLFSKKLQNMVIFTKNMEKFDNYFQNYAKNKYFKGKIFIFGGFLCIFC